MKDDKNKREIVLRGLKCCATDPNEFGDCASTDCPYKKSVDCHKKLLVDACELLEAQGPVKPIRKPEIFDSLYFCGKCSTKVGFQIRKDDSWRFKCKFCPNCGREVKWDG